MHPSLRPLLCRARPLAQRLRLVAGCGPRPAALRAASRSARAMSGGATPKATGDAGDAQLAPPKGGASRLATHRPTPLAPPPPPLVAASWMDEVRGARRAAGRVAARGATQRRVIPKGVFRRFADALRRAPHPAAGVVFAGLKRHARVLQPLAQCARPGAAPRCYGATRADAKRRAPYRLRLRRRFARRCAALPPWASTWTTRWRRRAPAPRARLPRPPGATSHTTCLRFPRSLALTRRLAPPQYKPETFEDLAYRQACGKLVSQLGYPAEVLSFEYDCHYVRARVMDVAACLLLLTCARFPCCTCRWCAALRWTKRAATC